MLDVFFLMKGTVLYVYACFYYILVYIHNVLTLIGGIRVIFDPVGIKFWKTFKPVYVFINPFYLSFIYLFYIPMQILTFLERLCNFWRPK